MMINKFCSLLQVDEKYLRVCSGKHQPDPISYFNLFKEYKPKPGGSFPGLRVIKSRVKTQEDSSKLPSIWIAKMGFIDYGTNDYSLCPSESLPEMSLARQLHNFLPIMEKISSDTYDLLNRGRYLYLKPNW